MEDNKVIITIEEVDALKKIQQDLNNISTNLGQIEMQSYELSEVKKQILQQLSEIRTTQQQLGATLSQKYGQGTIDLESGVFIKSS